MSTYTCLMDNKFTSSKEAINFCQELCSKQGFQIKQKPLQTNRTILVSIYHEQQEKDSLLLAQTERTEWIFVPKKIQSRIDQLLAENPDRTDMRDIIQLEFPDYKDGNSVPTKITERVQKLIMASTRLCSVVAANEDWASCVENDLIKMIESYRKCCKLPPHMLDGLVDLEPQKVYSDIDQAHQKAQHRSCTKKEQQEVKTAPKKRKMAAMTTDGLSAMIPSCTMYVRSQPLRSLSEPSSQPSRRTFNDLITAVPQPTTAPFGHVFNLASPISPSSSSIHQRLEFAGYSKHESMLQSPPIPDSMMVNNHYSTTARAFSVQNNAYSYPTTTTTTKKTTATATATASTTTTATMASATASAAQGNNMQFNFDTTSYSQQPVVIPPRQSPNSHYNNMYYPQTNFQQQQRMIMQQDYEQRQLLENNSNVHLPIIRNHFYQPSAQQGHSAQSWS